MSTQHTPGPWRVAPASDYMATDGALNVDAGTAGFVAKVGRRGDPVAEADARLIAAAPELLVALRETTEVACDRDRECDRGASPAEHSARCLRARAAIAQAEARQ